MKLSSSMLFISIFITSLAYSQSESFRKGWSDGYKEGYCYQKVGCVTPYVPIFPLPDIGNDTYKGGYNKGFLKGKSDNTETSSSNENGEYRPINADFGTQIRDYVRSENELKAERQSRRNQSLPYFREVKEKAFKAFNEKDYWECIIQYNNSKDLGWYDSEFELMIGISYGLIWKKSKDKSHLNMAKKLIKLSKKHGNPNAKRLLKELKEAVKKSGQEKTNNVHDGYLIIEVSI